MSLIDNASLQMQNVDVKVVDMYKAIRDILSKYRSGKLPKAFKIVPNLANWEQVCTLKPSFNVSISPLPVAAFLCHNTIEYFGFCLGKKFENILRIYCYSYVCHKCVLLRSHRHDRCFCFAPDFVLDGTRQMDGCGYVPSNAHLCL